MDILRWLSTLRLRLRAITDRADVERDIDEELSFHLAMRARTALERGASETEAIRQAHCDFGGVQQTKERLRDLWPFRWSRNLAEDLRYGVRSLRRSRGFSLAAVIVLALGIGANTALFSVISAVLFRPLPYPDAHRLVRIWTMLPQRSGSALPDYRAWRSRTHAFDDIGASHAINYNWTGTEQPERLLGTRVTASMWSVLRPKPVLGTLFSADAEQWGRHRVAVLSESLWRRRFGADLAVLGHTIQLNGQPFVIIGVLPSSFQYPTARTDLWAPIAYAPGDAMDTRFNHFVDLIGRLKPDVTINEAQVDLTRIADGVKQEAPENVGVNVAVFDWRDSIVGDVRPTLWLLFGAVGFVLLVACTNVANLVLARATTRDHEFSVRAALGASRNRLVRQLLTENLVLASIGAAVGLAVAHALIQALPTLGPIGLPRMREVALDRMVVAFAAGLALVTGVGFGVWPARYLERGQVAGHLNASPRSASINRSQVRTRTALLVTEVSLSVVLLIGAGLFITSLVRLERIEPGFRPDHLVTANVSLPPGRYGNAERVAAFIRQANEEVAGLAGVQSTAIATAVPLSGVGWGKYFSIDGRPAPASLAQVPSVDYRQITPDYFRTIGATLRRGRAFTSTDGPNDVAVAIVNDTLARTYWPHEDPLGQRVYVAPPETLVADKLPKGFPGFPRLTVVGVVNDVRESGLDHDVLPEVYVPFAQALPPQEDAQSSFSLVVRTAGDPLSYQRSIQTAINDIDRNLPISNVRTMEAALSQSLAQRRFAVLLLSGLAGVGLLLVVAGLYGVMAYLVGQRRRELAIRAALGATTQDLVHLVFRYGLSVAVTGALLGAFLAALLSRSVEAQLYQVKGLDPATYVGTTLLMCLVAAAACGVPALRAARVDPAVGLHED